jgi:hypothetical protein
LGEKLGMPYLVQQYQAKRGLDYEERSAPARIAVKLLSKSTMEEREHFLRVVFYLQMFTK